jgi:rare lipoprotein A
LPPNAATEAQPPLQNGFTFCNFALDRSAWVPRHETFCFRGVACCRAGDSALLLRGHERWRQHFFRQCDARQNSYRQATYYPDQLNGHKTAKGDTFHQSAHTAASNKLPLGTTAKVTNLKTGKSTDVTVTDRGPALGSHKIDLTKKAAKDIGLTRKEGIAPVKIKVIGTPGAAGAGPGQ